MEFLKFTPKKFLLAAALFALVSAVSPLLYGYVVLDAKLVGLSLPYVLEGFECGNECVSNVFWFQLLLDLAFWYLMASLIFHPNKRK